MTFEEWESRSHEWPLLPKHIFAAGAASRDAEVAELKEQRDASYKIADHYKVERDQLREQVKLLREIVRIAIERGDLYNSDQEQAEAVLAATEK